MMKVTLHKCWDRWNDYHFFLREHPAPLFSQPNLPLHVTDNLDPRHEKRTMTRAHSHRKIIPPGAPRPSLQSAPAKSVFWGISAAKRQEKPRHRNLGTDGTFPRFFANAIIERGYVPPVGQSIPYLSYLSPVRFLPSIMTLLNIRLIRVW